MKNRGMLLESLINKTIDMYRKSDIGVFHKKNIPIQFSKVVINQNRKEVRGAFIKSKSTTDYYGCWEGKFICFEAKSTNALSLPLSNIKEHQHKYLKTIEKNGGIAFYIIGYKRLNRFFMIKPKILEELKQKSLNIKIAEKKGIELELLYPGVLDFIPFLNKI